MPDYPPHVVAIDLSLTRTGVCFINGIDGSIDVFSVKSAADNGTVRDFSLRVFDIAAAIYQGTFQPGGHEVTVVIEGLSFNSRSSSVDRIHYTWYRVQEHLEKWGYPPAVVITPNQRAKYATGKGNAGKDEVLAAAVRRYPHAAISNNDEADAVVLAAIASLANGDGIESTDPTKAMRDVVEAIEWR